MNPNPNKEEKLPVLNKYVASSGMCTRREAADLIKRGLVTVNGEIVKIPYYRVQAGDEVRFNDEVITPEIKQFYVLLNKPGNFVSEVGTKEEGIKNLSLLLKTDITVPVSPIGLLSEKSRGLLFLTNDKGILEKLSASTDIQQVYTLRTTTPVSEEHLSVLKEGTELDGKKISVTSVARIEGHKGEELGIECSLDSDKGLYLFMEHFGYEVAYLDRTYFAGLTKKDLPRGRYRFLTEEEIRMMKHFT